MGPPVRPESTEAVRKRGLGRVESSAKGARRAGLQIGSGCGGLSGCPYRLNYRLRPEDGDHSLEVVGENVKAHLGSHFFECARQKVGRAHPCLDGPERMFGGLAADADGLGRTVQPFLYCIEDGFVLPAPDAPFLGGACIGVSVRSRRICLSSSRAA